MIHLVKNNKIARTEAQVPAMFERGGATFFGYDLLAVAEHYADGWRDEVVPAFNATLQRLGAPYYDAQTDKVTYAVVDLDFDIELLRVQRLEEFDRFQRNFRLELTQLYAEEMLMGEVPVAVVEMMQLLKRRKVEVIAELNGFADTGNAERLLGYRFETEEVHQFREALKSLKE